MRVEALRDMLRLHADLWAAVPKLSHRNTRDVEIWVDRRVRPAGAIQAFYRVRWCMLGLPH